MRRVRRNYSEGREVRREHRLNGKGTAFQIHDVNGPGIDANDDGRFQGQYSLRHLFGVPSEYGYSRRHRTGKLKGPITMKITLTCIWQPGQNPDTDPPLVALRSDRQYHRTLWPDELDGFERRHQPEWRQVQAGGWDDPPPIVYSAEIDLDTPLLCRCCNRTVPVEYINDRFMCASCANLPIEVQERLIEEHRAEFPRGVNTEIVAP